MAKYVNIINTTTTNFSMVQIFCCNNSNHISFSSCPDFPIKENEIDVILLNGVVNKPKYVVVVLAYKNIICKYVFWNSYIYSGKTQFDSPVPVPFSCRNKFDNIIISDEKQHYPVVRINTDNPIRCRYLFSKDLKSKKNILEQDYQDFPYDNNYGCECIIL